MMKRHIKYTVLTVALMLVPLMIVSGQEMKPFEVYHVSSISSGSDDMAPVIMSDGILFCSNRKTNPFLTKKNLEGIRLYELWFAPFNDEGEPVRPGSFCHEPR